MSTQSDHLNRLAILGASSSWHVQDLIRANKKLRLFAIDVIPFQSLQATVGTSSANNSSSNAGCSLDGYDAVIVRTMPRGTLEQIIVRMDVLGEHYRRGATVANPPRSLEIAIDKYLALSRLAQAGIAVPRTVVCQDLRSAVDAFESLNGDVVFKPLFGSEGRGLFRAQDRSSASAAAKQLLAESGVIYAQEFIATSGFDIRLFAVGDEVLGIRRSNASDWRHNIQRGAKATTLAVCNEMHELAMAAVRATGCLIAGIDVVPDASGQLWTLEVNAVPGWKGLAATTGRDVAELVLRCVARLHGSDQNNRRRFDLKCGGATKNTWTAKDKAAESY